MAGPWEVLAEKWSSASMIKVRDTDGLIWRLSRDSLSLECLWWLRMHKRIEVKRPAYAERLWHYHLRCVLVPESITEPFDSWWTEIVRNTKESAMPGALFRWAVQLLPYRGCYVCSEQERESHVSEGRRLFVTSHSFSSLSR